jgi:tRNA(fMet)-specific endonuclease VapC
VVNILIDTDIIIDILRRKPEAVAFSKSLEIVSISSLTAFELINGCINKENLKETLKLIEGVSIIYPNEQCQKISLGIFSKFKLRYGIGLVDSLIAGIAINEGYTLATRNLKHFEFLDDIKIIQPY